MHTYIKYKFQRNKIFMMIQPKLYLRSKSYCWLLSIYASIHPFIPGQEQEHHIKKFAYLRKHKSNWAQWHTTIILTT